MNMNHEARFKVTLRCKHTNGEFDVWVHDEAEVPAMAAHLEAEIVAVAPSTDTDLVLAQLLTALGLRQQLRVPE